MSLLILAFKNRPLILFKKIDFYITYNNKKFKSLRRYNRRYKKSFWTKKTKAIKDRILRDIKNLFEHKEEIYYKPVRVNNFWSNNYIEYKSNGDRNKTLSVVEYLNKISPYLKDINNLENSDTWKIQLTIANDFISSIDNDKERVMHSKTNVIEIMISDEVDVVIK